MGGSGLNAETVTAVVTPPIFPSTTYQKEGMGIHKLVSIELRPRCVSLWVLATICDLQNLMDAIFAASFMYVLL